MTSLPDDYRCSLCGRTGNRVYRLDGFPLALCTSGEYSCLFYQVLRHGRSAEEIIELALERIFANSLKGKLNRPVFMRIVTQYLFGTEKDLCGVIAIPTLMHSFFRGNWLRDTEHLCHVYDARFLRRYVASLSIHSLQKLIAMEKIIRSEFNEYAGRMHLSALAMRRILSITFAKLTAFDEEIYEVQKMWSEYVEDD